MRRRSLAGLILAAALALPAHADTASRNEIDRVFDRLYNFDFDGAHAAVDRHIQARPEDPMGYAMCASTYLFFELDRLGILESEFFADDRRIIDKKKLKPDPTVKTRLFQAVEQAQSRALKILETSPNDTTALFSMCVTGGVVTDYTALVEKRQLGSLTHIKRTTAYAQRLLKADPNFYDAHVSTGMTEYVIGSLPFFIRWFVRVDDIKGSKEQGIKSVEIAASKGHYLAPFARILLAMAYLREKKPSRAEGILQDLARDYPENRLFRKEQSKIAAKLRSGEIRDE